MPRWPAAYLRGHTHRCFSAPLALRSTRRPPIPRHLAPRASRSPIGVMQAFSPRTILGAALTGSDLSIGVTAMIALLGRFSLLYVTHLLE